AGFGLLTQLHYGSSYLQLTIAMIVLGLGLGATMQTYTLVVQNTAERRDLGVATSATQFFRSAGGTGGTAGLGPVLASRLPAGTEIGIDAVLDPNVLAQLPDPVEEAIRMGLADALHQVFVVAIPLVVVAFLATLFIKALPLRETLHEAPAERAEGALEAAGPV